MTTSDIEVSVVIPTFNRRHLLERTVPALAAQSVDGCAYEVIYVVNGSTDGSEPLLRQAESEWPNKIRCIYIDPTGTPSAPRNRGIRESRGAVIIILDDDVLPDPDLVRRHVEFHRDHPELHHAALGSLTVPDEVLDDPVSVFHDMISFAEMHGRERLSFLDFWTCNVSMKRSFMLEHGMFDESISYYEDVDCGYRLAVNGMHLHFLPEAKGLHLHQQRVEDVPRKGRMIGRGLYEFEHRVPPREARQIRTRHGILSRDLPVGVLLRRLINRAGFAVLGNAASLRLLELLAGGSRKRSPVTDLYLYVLFRGHMRAGYRDAKREARSTES